ncbi:MAG: DUF1971 domain-containing protein [Alphaproteobacteria bacterium]|nr:DUF1971 domain-containing protein [Alphaproteobacteria bacterium]
MRALPRGLTAYHRTPIFDADTIPKALLRAHATKAGVWGVLTVTSGHLLLTVPDTQEQIELSPGLPGVIEPEVVHFVTPSGPVSFCIEFWK